MDRIFFWKKNGSISSCFLYFLREKTLNGLNFLPKARASRDQNFYRQNGHRMDRIFYSQNQNIEWTEFFFEKKTAAFPPVFFYFFWEKKTLNGPIFLPKARASKGPNFLPPKSTSNGPNFLQPKSKHRMDRIFFVKKMAAFPPVFYFFWEKKPWMDWIFCQKQEHQRDQIFYHQNWHRMDRIFLQPKSKHRMDRIFFWKKNGSISSCFLFFLRAKNGEHLSCFSN